MLFYQTEQTHKEWSTYQEEECDNNEVEKICFGLEHARLLRTGLKIWTGLISCEMGVS